MYNFKFRYACQVVDLIVAISECTKRDIMHFYHLPEKIDVVYQGCDPQAFGFGRASPVSRK
ncbi:MAG: hypothetical protein V8R52_01085 [Coprobacter fastidiosus]